MPQHVVVVPYQPAWAEVFRRESEAVKAALGENCLRVYHIGSTAVEGLDAKPIVDLMPVVQRLGAVDARAEALRALGYEYLGEFGIPGRRYLRKGGDERTHQRHIFQAATRLHVSSLRFYCLTVLDTFPLLEERSYIPDHLKFPATFLYCILDKTLHTLLQLSIR